jgi:Lon protease-like protein
MTIRPMFPLESVRLPGEDLPLRIFEPRYGALVRECLSDAREFGVVLIAAGREVGGEDARCDVGSMAHIVACEEMGDGLYLLECDMRERIRVTAWLEDDPYPRADVEPWPDEPGMTVTIDDIGVVEDRVMEVFEWLAASQEVTLPSRSVLLGEPEPGDDVGKRGAVGRAARCRRDLRGDDRVPARRRVAATWSRRTGAERRRTRVAGPRRSASRSRPPRPAWRRRRSRPAGAREPGASSGRHGPRGSARGG